MLTVLARRLRALSLLAAVAGCGDARPVAGGSDALGCARCHGSPPPAGAHSRHVDAGIDCATCHGATVGAPAQHGDGRVDVEFTGVALAQHATPTYEEASSTCSGVYCHAPGLGGGTQPAPVWTGSLSGCTSCHGFPPVPPHAASETACASCHATTVDASGNVIAGGTHVDGRIDGGHEPGFADPSVHGRQFFATAGTTASCATCHGADYGNAIVRPDVAGQPNQSCNSCHAARGWGQTPDSPSWQTNCSFCHGVKDAATQVAGYAVADHPTWSAPPDAISQRLGGGAAPDRTGAHTAHLTSPWATVRCGACHVVPTALTHISGADARAAVVLAAPGAYAANTTCNTACHGANPSPAWASTEALRCDGCHAVPPATRAHLGLTGAHLGAECSGCHPRTISPDGTIDVAAGGHINGTIDSPEGHAPVGGQAFVAPSVHGSQFLDALASAGGASSCTACHEAYASCDACHADPPVPFTTRWTNGWRTNCTFCHGERTPAYSAADLVNAAPPDDVSQRLTGVEVPDRTGRHPTHLRGGGFVPAPEYPCATCHRIPSDLGHVSAGRRATVAITREGAFPSLAAGDLARLPDPLGTYAADGSCTSYCHGATMQGGINTVMKWTNDFDTGTSILGCTDCHGLPPPTGSNVVGNTYALPPPTNTRYCGTAGCSNHAYHRQALTANGYGSCASCHYGSAQGTFYAGLHASGKPDVVFTPAGTAGSKSFTASWDPVTRSCLSTCHTKSGADVAQTW